MKNTVSLILALATFAAFGQKKTIDHTTYDEWKSLRNAIISNDGAKVAYVINPHKGDGYLYIYWVESGRLDSIPRGKNPQFAGDGSFLAFKIDPGHDTLRTCERKKVEKDKWPKDSLGIYVFANDTLIKEPKLKSLSVNEENGWMVYQVEHNTLPVEGKRKHRRRRRRESNYESDGNLLTILHPQSGDKKIYRSVIDHAFSEYGKWVGFTVHRREKETKLDSVHLHTFNTETQSEWCSTRQFNGIDKITFDKQEMRMAFLATNDTSKVKHYGLELLDLSSSSITHIADSSQSFFPEDYGVSEHRSLRFTHDGSILYFGGKELARPEPEDTLLESEKVQLDIWHHADQRLQPMQLIERKHDEKRTDLFAWHFHNSTAVQLSSDTLDVPAKSNSEGKYLLGSSNESYAHTYNWTVPYPKDHYAVSIETGEAKLIKRASVCNGQLSPSGKWYTYYDYERHNFYVIDVAAERESCLTCSIDNVLWERDVNGMPMEACAYGVVGWKRGEEFVYIQSEFDIWGVSMTNGSVVCITEEKGSKNKIEMRAYPWSYDSVYVDFQNYYVRGFDRRSKGVHLFSNQSRAGVNLVESAYYDEAVVGLTRSKNGYYIIGRRMTAEKYPDLYINEDFFDLTKKISVTNPQQDEYNWVTVERVSWMAYDSTWLEGLLYKPENYDPNQSYPLMVYFYELYSDEIHSHYIPKPTASIVYATEYASAGYMVFIPDIRYKAGHPGNSAYNCIMSGTDHILKLYPNVDSTRMALQGQSWGGYQTAQLITMTNRYKAAMAGAPVSNMFSAYGGIRWNSGLNRQFQYECTQSRIGHTIWDAPELYVENSPLFHLPKVETPLLIMHNDNDGAVPWYQGIELFTGLKRLGKTTWMLNYNDEQHNLMEDANRRDLSRRMRQFFDYYLLGAPAAEWMIEGIPAVDKGKNFGWDPVE